MTLGTSFEQTRISSPRTDDAPWHKLSWPSVKCAKNWSFVSRITSYLYTSKQWVYSDFYHTSEILQVKSVEVLTVIAINGW